MNKTEFLKELRRGLSQYSHEEAEERIAFYSEMIDDRIEEGLGEEDAVAEVCRSEDVFFSSSDHEASTGEEDTQKRRLSAVEITLLIVGFPIWLPILVSLFAVIISLFAALWSVVISLWAAFGAVAASGVGSVIGGIIIAVSGDMLPGMALLGAGLVCMGLSVFMFMLCKLFTKLSVKSLVSAIKGIKKLFKKWRSA